MAVSGGNEPYLGAETMYYVADPFALKFVLEDLTTFTEYMISIAAFTSFGVGPFNTVYGGTVISVFGCSF